MGYFNFYLFTRNCTYCIYTTIIYGQRYQPNYLHHLLAIPTIQLYYKFPSLPSFQLIYYIILIIIIGISFISYLSYITVSNYFINHQLSFTNPLLSNLPSFNSLIDPQHQYYYGQPDNKFTNSNYQPTYHYYFSILFQLTNNMLPT